jgi:hypothetical protein
MSNANTFILAWTMTVFSGGNSLLYAVRGEHRWAIRWLVPVAMNFALLIAAAVTP